jgi:hypothetical protein
MGVFYPFGMVLVARRLGFGWCSLSYDATTQNDEETFLK